MHCKLRQAAAAGPTHRSEMNECYKSYSFNISGPTENEEGEYGYSNEGKGTSCHIREMV